MTNGHDALSDRLAWAQHAYRRMLASWAQDVLILRARGLTRPGWPSRPTVERPVMPPSTRVRVTHAGTGQINRAA